MKEYCLVACTPILTILVGCANLLHYCPPLYSVPQLGTFYIGIDIGPIN